MQTIGASTVVKFQSQSKKYNKNSSNRFYCCLQEKMGNFSLSKDFVGVGCWTMSRLRWLSKCEALIFHFCLWFLEFHCRKEEVKGAHSEVIRLISHCDFSCPNLGEMALFMLTFDGLEFFLLGFNFLPCAALASQL